MAHRASYLLSRGLDAVETEAFLRSKAHALGRRLVRPWRRPSPAPASTSVRLYVMDNEARHGAGWLAAEANALALDEAL